MKHTVQGLAKGWIEQLAKDERGTVAILFGLMFMVIMFMIGIAVDQARIYDTNTRVAAAADAAALAGARALLDGRNTDAEVIAITQSYFTENATGAENIGDVNGLQVAVNRAAGTVTVQADASVPMTITKIAGPSAMDLEVRSATAYDQRDIELGMALDITGSMRGTKIADLKVAAKDLVDILMPDRGNTNTVRIGIAPYSAAVRLGSYAAAVTNRTSTDGCVRERTGPQAYTDAAPGPGAYFTAGGAPSDIDPTEGTQHYACPDSVIRPLTSDKAALKSAIDALQAKAATAGHIGTHWAWDLISPEWANVWPAASRPVPYGTPDTIKAVIVMTDGIYNVAYANGRASNQARSLCSGMKQKDVTVFTVAFDSPPAAEALLRECASSEQHFFSARDRDSLRAAFQAIATRLTNLRLTQ